MHISVENIDRRTFSDRRKRLTPIMSRYTFIGGQRKTMRRKGDIKRYTFVDLFSVRLLIILLSLFLLNYIDSYLTLTLIKKGIVVEVNPIMAFFLEYGTLSFILTKSFITAVSLTIICMLKNICIARLVLPLSIMMYLFIIIYELILYIYPYWL